MLSKKSFLGGFVALGVIIVMAVLLVPGVQSKSNDLIGVVNMELVFTEYMAQPLFDARDQMQAEFDQKMNEDIADEQLTELFMEYQKELEVLELEYLQNTEDALAEVAVNNGLEIIVDSGAVLYGGIDVTQEVLGLLK